MRLRLLRSRSRVRPHVRGAVEQGLVVHRRGLRGVRAHRRERRDRREDQAVPRYHPVAEAHHQLRRRDEGRRRRHHVRGPREDEGEGTDPRGGVEGHRLLHLHERDHGQSEGRHPLAREHRVERDGDARRLPDVVDGPLAVVPAVGALVRADGGAARSVLDGRFDGDLRERRQDPRQPRRDEAHAPIQRASHLQQALRGGAEADLDEARLHPVDGEELARDAPEAAQRRRGRLAGRARARHHRQGRLLEGASALRRQLEVRIQRRLGHLRRRRGVHRLARHHGVRGLRPHRDLADFDRELSGKSQDRQRRQGRSPAWSSIKISIPRARSSFTDRT